MIGENGKWGSWKAAVDLTPDMTRLLERTSEVIKRRLHSYGINKERFGLIHADLRLANLLIEDDQIKVI
jgi:Ser/Thr protein kinase RdoA (MazF antagonist)